jgi:hypothetical protein
LNKLIKSILLATSIATGLTIVGGVTSFGGTQAEAKTKKIVITKKQFLAVKNGMTEAQVFKILGGKGEIMSESGVRGKQFYTVMYMYYGKGMTGANANFMFQDGKLQSKAQFGLK